MQSIVDRSERTGMNGLSRALGFGLVLICFAFKPARAESWGSTSAEELGISQGEFKKVKESGMSKSQLLHLLEIGVSPNEYFKEPWKQLGVTESYWLSQRKMGMKDDDFNGSYHRQQSSELTPLIAFLLPGYYHYQTHRPYTGALLSTLAAGSVAVLAFDRDIPPAYPITVLAAAMLWSAGDAFIKTRYSDNQDAKRFSFNLVPQPKGGEVLLAVHF